MVEMRVPSQPSTPDCEAVEVSQKFEIEVTCFASSRGSPASPACPVLDVSSSTVGDWNVVSLTIPSQEELIDLAEFLSAKGIFVHDVPFIGSHKYRKSYDLVVRESFLDSLVAKLPDCVIVRNYNPTRPTKGEVCEHGAVEALQRIQTDFINNAAMAVTKSWDQGLSRCFRDIAKADGLTAKLERSIFELRRLGKRSDTSNVFLC